MTRVVHLISTPNTALSGDAVEQVPKGYPGAEEWVPRAELERVREALTQIDALDPEGMIDGCSQAAIRGLVLRMGEIARAALAALPPPPGGDDEGEE